MAAQPAAQSENDREAYLAMRSYIQRVATGPEYSKDISFDEAYAAMQNILQRKADAVQAGVFLIALRMKRETDEENAGALRAIIDTMEVATAPVEEVVDVADPYDGYTRGLPVTAFMPAVLAACGLPAVTHGVEYVGPKYGITPRKVLRAAGRNVDLTPVQAAQRLGEDAIGWAYIDQKAYCPALHALVPLRSQIVKRPLLTTVEVLTGPVRGQRHTHLMTGYVHKPYPPIYAYLARQAGFDSGALIRGVEGGTIPSLKQASRFFHYHDEGSEPGLEVTSRDIHPKELGIEQETRAVPLPKGELPASKQAGIGTDYDIEAAAAAAARAGLAALDGQAGPAYDSLVYGAAITLLHLKRHDDLAEAGQAVRHALDSGAARQHFEAGA